MSVADVDRVKNDLKNFLEMLTSRSTFYTLIENCVKQFWSKHTERHPGMGGWETNVVWRALPMSTGDARTIIITKVIPWLREAKSYIDTGTRYYGDFQYICTYTESHFAPTASVQPAPPTSNPSPPVTDRATTDAVASLQYQVKALQDKITAMELQDIVVLFKEIKDLKEVQSENSKESFDSQVKALQDQINVLKLAKMEFDSFYQTRYKIDIPYFNDEITALMKDQIKDKASFDSQIATLRAQVDDFPGILKRVQTLENTISTFQKQTVKPKSWRGSEQPTFLDSRPDTHPQGHLNALLHKMHDLH